MKNLKIFLYILSIITFKQVHFGNETVGKKWISSSTEELMEASSRNDPYAQACLALMYVHGEKGNKIDHEKAFKLALLSSESDHWLGHFALGYLYRTGPIGPDIQKVRDYYLKSFQDQDGKMVKLAARKDPIASYALGEIFTADELRPFVLPDLKLAFRHYEISTEQGFVPSSIQMALFKIHSLIDSDNSQINEIKEGIEILKSAVAQNSPAAHHYIGRAYSEGLGVEKDMEMAFVHFQEAANRGFGESQLIMADFYGQGLIAAPKIDMAIRYAKLALKSDYKRAQKKLSEYENKRDALPENIDSHLQSVLPPVPEVGPPLPSPPLPEGAIIKNPVSESSHDGFDSKLLPSGFSYNSKTTIGTQITESNPVKEDNSPPDNITILPSGPNMAREKAKSYYWGRGRDKDYDRAYNLFLESASDGDAESFRYLGLMHLTGKGVKKDLNISVEWFEKAASGGDGMALKYLERLRDIMAK